MIFKITNSSFLVKIAKKYKTPLYIYDADIIYKQYKYLYNKFNKCKNITINFSCKANNNINILKLFKNFNCGIDVVSIEEIYIAIKSGFTSNRIMYTPNSVCYKEIIEASKFNVKIILDDIYIIKKFNEFNKNYPIGLRINPNILSGGNKNISVGYEDSKFGIPYYKIKKIINVLKSLYIKIEGLHIHVGSDISNNLVFIKVIDILFNISKLFNNLKYINIGGGFKIKYYNNDTESNINYISNVIKYKINNYRKKYNNNILLILESGKFLIGSAGYFIVSVNTIKKTKNKILVSVNSGFNHFIRPMFYNSYHEIINLSNPNDINITYDIVGYICEKDTFISNRKISKIRIGDLLCFMNTGAYCYTMSSNYNSRLRPIEILIKKKKFYLIRKKERLNNLLQNIVNIKDNILKY